MDTPTGPTIDHNSYIGASDIGAIAGQNPFATALDIWAPKTGKAPGFEGNIHTDIGNAFERPALGVYANETGAQLSFPGTLIHPVDKWAGATPDAVVDDSYCAECKIVGFRSARFWGDPEDGPDGVPAYVLCQVHWQSWIVRTLNIAPCEIAKVPAFFGTEMKLYEIPIDTIMIEQLREIGHEFWTQNVVKGIMPAVEGDSARDIIEAIHPKHTKILLEPMTDEIAQLAVAYDEARDAEKQAEKEKEQAAAMLTSRIGDAAGFEGNGIKTTWKNPKGKPSWKAIAEAAGARLDRHIFEMLIKDHTPDEGKRRLNVSIK